MEQGSDAPLEEIARRAGVGIATLYRRFPDRQLLQRAVALDVLDRVLRETRVALVEEPDAFGALARYMHRAIDLRHKHFDMILANHFSESEPAFRGNPS